MKKCDVFKDNRNASLQKQVLPNSLQFLNCTSFSSLTSNQVLENTPTKIISFTEIMSILLRKLQCSHICILVYLKNYRHLANMVTNGRRRLHTSEKDTCYKNIRTERRFKTILCRTRTLDKNVKFQVTSVSIQLSTT